jgi:hypothetical protein
MWWFLHLELIQAGKNQSVQAGQRIGFTGATGEGISGPHLHVEYIAPGSSTKSDPYLVLQRIYESQQYGLQTQSEDIYEFLPNTEQQSTAQEDFINAAKYEAQAALKATDEEAEALVELFQLLSEEGWYFYDKDSSVTNVWQKTIVLDINHSGLDRVTGIAQEPEVFRQAGIICTAINGSISHIVSKIPILSHEWPTHQHLGSIEPKYELEFMVLDDQTDLEGIGSMAQLVQGMRSVAQSNSRKFRPIIDGHCIATDTFITRLLGTYQNNDLKVLEALNEIADIDLKKKTVISSSYSGTVDGNPGLSVINYTLEETNPYEPEKLFSTAPSLQDKETSRKQVLQKIYDLDVVAQYKPIVVGLFVGSKINPNLIDPRSDSFGKFLLKKNPAENFNQPYLYVDTVSDERLAENIIVFPYGSPSELDWLNTLGIDYDDTSWGQGWASIPSTYLDTASTQSNYQLPGYVAGMSGYAYVAPDDITLPPLEESVSYNLLDMAKINNNSDIDFAAFQRFADYYVAIKQTLETGERIMAEAEAGGLTKEFISSFLYDLPIKNNMWKIWEMFLEEFVQERALYPDSTVKAGALEQLHENSAWPYVGKATWADPVPEQYRPALRTNIQTTLIQHGWNILGYLDEPLIKAGYNVGAALSSSIDLATYQREKRKTAISRLVNYYLWTLPISFSLPDWVKATYGTYIGEVISSDNLDSPSATAPALRSTYQSFFDNADSCGNITQNYFSATPEPVWVVTNESIGQRGGVLGHNLDSLLAPATTQADIFLQGPYYLFGSSRKIDTYKYADSLVSKPLQLTGTEEFLRPYQQIGNTPGSPFVYHTDQATEQQKAYYLKNIFATFADGILADYAVLKIIGLESLMFLDPAAIEGKECYPDIDLPAHPYYGSTKLVSPDFFMWNIYEDADALNIEQQEKIQVQVDAVILNSYQSMKRLEQGDTFDTNSDTVLSENSINSDFKIDTKLSAEGTDGNAQNGVSTTPFYPVQAAAKDTEDWVSALTQAKGGSGNIRQIGNGIRPIGFNSSKKDYYSTKPSDFLHGLRVSNAESVFGGGQTGFQYPARLSNEQYAQLKVEFEATTQMFGSVEGYMNQQLNETNFPTVASELTGTSLERPFEIAHTFDIKSLQKLSKDSAKDLISHKMTLRGAFPTYKLFFIEEDEFETRFINFDDFYSYNAVKSFSVVLSRKIPADTAIISLQNVQGSLDGTRRSTVTDLDYFSGDTVKKKLQANGDTDASLLSGEPVTTGTSSEQPFSAVVLRPGLNVQLRAGYSNDPDNLHVLLSGRIVDVTYNQTGDLAEIMVQSFGTELAQVLKGTSRDSNIVTYTTTHQLLASMMLEPEVTHFGRWEFGQTYFIGEAKDHKLDFVDYSRAGYLGRFKNTEGITRWIIDHPKTVLAIGVGVTALSFLPLGAVGKVLGKSKIGRSLFGVGGNTALWESGYRAIWGGAPQGVVTGAEAISQGVARTGLARAIDQSLDKLGAAAVKAAADAPEMALLVAQRTAATKGEIVGKLLAGQADDAIAIAASTEKYLQGLAFKSRWMTKPWVSAGEAGFISAIGSKPFTTGLNVFLGTQAKLIAAGIAAGAALDIGSLISDWYGPGLIGRWVKNFFGRKQATMFLTPQDDNLFPPHPKDYMNLDQGIAETVFKFTTRSLGAIGFSDPDAFDNAYRMVFPDSLLSKKASPAAYRYQPVTSTIWDIFEEMSIRHPGWIFGTRPYGNAFRYTMFFGLPAQRYWARPATNGFIYRANQLRKVLDDSNNLMISEAQFKQLYGETVLNEILLNLEANSVAPIDSNMSVDLSLVEEVERIRREQIFGSYAIKEYLRALEVRFEPFRRYHLLTSDRDIVWNGIMGTENAVSNAVDVTYFADENIKDIYDFGAVVQTAVFKAHAFIPEDQLRIAPVRWPNCKGYALAMRYGMGELLARIKDMYRGEIILRGNPRIRPWDIAILVDNYNDMVGPVEIEQVVHTFSHETGFITEIKPSAVAFANEISGWPLIEGMKLFAMAIEDIHSRYQGLSASTADRGLGDPGILSAIANQIATAGSLPRDTLIAATDNIEESITGRSISDHHSKLDSFLKEKYSRIFGTQGATVKSVFGDTAPPNLNMLDGMGTDIFQDLGIGVGIAGSVLALGGAVATFSQLEATAAAATNATGLLQTIKAAKAAPGTVAKAFIKNPYGLAAVAATVAAGAAAVAGFGSAVAVSKMGLPSIGWLMGSSVLFLQCLRTDAIMLVPLIKGGTPIVAGLATNDPAMIWKTFRGRIERVAQETIKGTTDMLTLYSRYGSALWEQAKNDGIWDTDAPPNLTGEQQGIVSQ